MNLQRVFLHSLIASVLVSAVLGILALATATFGPFEERVVLTTLMISLASLLGLACGSGLGKPWAWLSWIGIGLATLDAALTIFGIWTGADLLRYWKASAILTVWAVVCAHLTLLLLRNLSARYRWSLWTGVLAVVFLAGLITAAILSDVAGALTSAIGIGGIAATANSILVVIFERLSRGDLPRPIGRAESRESRSIDAEIQRLKARIVELENSRGRA